MSPAKGISSTGVTLLVGLILMLFLLFVWRVWTYYGQITRGETVALPQFGTDFTSANGSSGPVSVAGMDTEDDPFLGPEDAKLVVVEFLDYQCPYCGQASSLFREAAAKYHDRVKFVVRDFPVQELHPDAVEAAEAAGCAQAQGKFWPMHDRLFSLKGQLSRADLDRAAEQSGLDLDVYGACMDLHVRLDEIESDAADGLAAGVRGTPTFFFNGRPVEGAIPREAFDALIRRIIDAS